MSKHKLTNQEIAAFLDNFDIADVPIRNVWSQKALFIVSFSFVNAYVLFYIIGHTVFPDAMLKFKHLTDLRDGYVALLNVRSVVGLVLLCLFNIAFFFTNYFRFIATVGLAYLTCSPWSPHL